MPKVALLFEVGNAYARGLLGGIGKFILSHGPWSGRTYGGSSFVADGRGQILLTLRDRDTDVRIIELALGAEPQ